MNTKCEFPNPQCKLGTLAIFAKKHGIIVRGTSVVFVSELYRKGNTRYFSLCIHVFSKASVSHKAQTHGVVTFCSRSLLVINTCDDSHEKISDTFFTVSSVYYCALLLSLGLSSNFIPNDFISLLIPFRIIH